MIDKNTVIGDILETHPCNFCGSAEQRIVFERRYELDEPASTFLERLRSAGGDLLFDRVVQCTSCGLTFIDPRVPAEILLAEYRNATIHGYKDQFVSQNRGREQAFRTSLKHLHALLPQRGRMLDVGTAAGSFLALARDQGWTVTGCEPNAWFCQWGKEHYGLDIDQGTLFEQSYPPASFDIITLWDVIEHVTDPAAIIRTCGSLLKPGGYLVLTFPDIGSWIARLMGRRWVFLMSVHLYYFSKRVMTAMLAANHFSFVTSFPHIQTLQLDYLLYRMSIHSKLLAAIVGFPFRLLRVKGIMVPYWVGINCIIARKQD